MRSIRGDEDIEYVRQLSNAEDKHGIVEISSLSFDELQGSNTAGAHSHLDPQSPHPPLRFHHPYRPRRLSRHHDTLLPSHSNASPPASSEAAITAQHPPLPLWLAPSTTSPSPQLFASSVPLLPFSRTSSSRYAFYVAASPDVAHSDLNAPVAEDSG